MGVYDKLIAVQEKLRAPKSQYNSFGKYKYRNVEDILEAVKPLCAEQKAVIFIYDQIECVGGRFYVKATATFQDCESDGYVQVSAYAREDEVKKGMDGSQVTGASSSYARKYALGGLLCVDDGRDADSLPPDTDRVNHNEKAATKRAEPNTEKPSMCADCGKPIKDSKKRDGTPWSAQDIVTYSYRMFSRCLCPACQKKAYEAVKNDRAAD